MAEPLDRDLLAAHDRLDLWSERIALWSKSLALWRKKSLSTDDILVTATNGRKTPEIGRGVGWKSPCLASFR